jgi:hypothetical protein
MFEFFFGNFFWRHWFEADSLCHLSKNYNWAWDWDHRHFNRQRVPLIQYLVSRRHPRKSTWRALVSTVLHHILWKVPWNTRSYLCEWWSGTVHGNEWTWVWSVSLIDRSLL